MNEIKLIEKKPSLRRRLIEWGIALSIIAFMFALALPQLLHPWPPAKQSEAKENLEAIFKAQMKYFDKHKTYAPGGHLQGADEIL